MRLTRREAAAAFGITGGAALTSPAQAENMIADLIGDKDEFLAASEAYIYGYPLVTMEMTRRVVTNVAAPVGTRAPMGNIIKLRSYPDAKFRDVTAPNADTLYTTSFLDVGKEPWILSLPDMKGRYFLFPMLSGWTDVFQVPGTRTTGTGAQTYAITGPGWKGTLPAGGLVFISSASSLKYSTPESAFTWSRTGVFMSMDESTLPDGGA